MNILYMDCFSGISGNMTIGAFLDLGVKEEFLIKELEKLNLDGYKIAISKKNKNGIQGTYFDVILENEENHACESIDDHGHSHKQAHGYTHNHGHSHDHDHKHFNDCGHSHSQECNHKDGHTHTHAHGHRNLNDIKKLIDESELSDKVKELSMKIFGYVAEAEAKIHGKPIDEVHFHEVGAIDSIIDIVGTAICIGHLNIEKVVASKLHVGTGFVKCQHGLIPVPAPATLEIIKNGNIPVYSKGIQGELVTPTGAAIVAALGDEFGNQPEMEIESIGYGAGYKEFEIPNVLRLILGKKKLTQRI